MKRLYIQPNTEINSVNLKGSVLEDKDPKFFMDNGSHKTYGTSMDSNQGGFDEDVNDFMPTSTSLWDE